MAIGRVLGLHGVRGDIRIEVLAPDSCFRAGALVSIADREYEVERLRRSGKRSLLKLAGVEDRNAADEVPRTLIEIPEGSLEALPEGQYYRFQLIGLRVRTTDGRELGELAEVMNTGADDVYTVRGPLGEVLIPATAEVIVEVDLEGGTMVVEAVPGLLD